MSSETCLIDKMLNRMSACRKAKELQISAMTDVLKKSNNTLLQLEASRSIKPATDDPHVVPFTFKKETVNVLEKIMDKSIHFMSSNRTAAPPTSDTGGKCLDDYIEVVGQRAEYLDGNFRKVVAVWDSVQQMRMVLLRQEMELESNDQD